ncbi:hypothetical protein D3C81_1348160 [compost metagenome]
MRTSNVLPFASLTTSLTVAVPPAKALTPPLLKRTFLMITNLLTIEASNLERSTSNGVKLAAFGHPFTLVCSLKISQAIRLALVPLKPICSSLPYFTMDRPFKLIYTSWPARKVVYMLFWSTPRLMAAVSSWMYNCL